MKNIISIVLAAILLIASHSAFAQNQVGGQGCNQSAFYDAATSGLTQIIPAPSASQVTYICGYTISSTAAESVNLDQGTGTNCGTGTAELTPVNAFVAKTTIGDASSVFRGLKSLPGQAVCINTSGAGQVGAIVYYTQF